MQQEQEKKVIIERQNKLHSELHKIKKSNDTFSEVGGIAQADESSVGGSNINGNVSSAGQPSKSSQPVDKATSTTI